MKTLFKTFLITLAFLFFISSIGFTATPYDTFKTVTYTGNGGTQSITELGFKPDLVWIKGRTNTSGNYLFDTIRGPSNSIRSDDTNSNIFTPTGLTSFDSDSFTIGSWYAINQSNVEYVAWCWKAGDAAVSNTNGSITSTVSANPDAGFSIVKYTGNGVAGATFGHGLEVMPEIVMIKDLSTGTYAWAVWNKNLTDGNYLSLNNPSPQDNSVNQFGNAITQTSNLITLGTWTHANNTSGHEMIAYCWASIAGLSDIGSYTGNGSTDGPIINCGFQPAYVMIKRADSSSSWHILDSKRDTLNPNNHDLYANSSDAEYIGFASDTDFTATGFQVKNASLETNATGGTYIYMAFAENKAPQISFTSDVPSIDHAADPAETAMLSWSASYADNVAIEPGGFSSVDLSGTLEVSPDSPTTYTLTVTVGEDTFIQQIFIDVVGGYDEDTGFSVKGPMGIGVINPTQALEVNGTIKAREVIVTNDGWADYVFADNYKLQNLSSVENHIKTYRHLPGIPSANQISTDGLSVSKMMELQMKKIEELTLYIIELSKENKRLEQRLNAIE